MISPDVRFEGFDARSWTNLLSLFAPGIVERIERGDPGTDDPEIQTEPVADGERSHPHLREWRATMTADGSREWQGTVIIVHEADGRVLKALHSIRGRVAGVAEAPSDDAGLETLCRDTGARRVVVVRRGVLEELAERLSMRLQRGDDYLTQCLAFLRAIREYEDAGLLRRWPHPRAHAPIPSPPTVRRAIDLILPDDHAMVAVLWDRGSTWTALVLRRHAGSIDLVAGPDLLAAWTGPLGGDWRRDYRVITDAVSRTVAPVHFGVFSEASTMRELLRVPDPGAWARAAAVRDIIVHPAPPYVAVAIGADALRAVASTSARLFGGLDLLGAFGPVGRYLRGRVVDVASVTGTLGFNPLRLLAESLQRRETVVQNETDGSVEPNQRGSREGDLPPAGTSQETRGDPRDDH